MQNHDFLRLFLESAELPAALKLVQDSRMRGPDPQDGWFGTCLGQFSGMNAWEDPTYRGAVQRLVDIRWVFPTAEQAANYHKHTLNTNCEGMPYLPQAPAVGQECYAFGGQQELSGLAKMTSFMYLFRVGCVVVKVYAAQGDQPLTINQLAALAQTVEHRLTVILAELERRTPANAKTPTQPVPASHREQAPTQPAMAPPPNLPPGYSYPPGVQPPGIYQDQFQGVHQSFPPVPMSQGHSPYGGFQSPPPTQQPGSGLAIGYAVCGVLSAITSFPPSILLFELFDRGDLYGDDDDIFVICSVLTVILAIPSMILLLTWLYQTWSAVPERFRKGRTPGTAIGFLFIPLFNVYWMFRSIAGVSAAIQRAHYGLGTGYEGGAGFGLAVAGLTLMCVPTLTPIAHILLVLWILFANHAKNLLLKAQNRM